MCVRSTCACVCVCTCVCLCLCLYLYLCTRVLCTSSVLVWTHATQSDRQPGTTPETARRRACESPLRSNPSSLPSAAKHGGARMFSTPCSALPCPARGDVAPPFTAPPNHPREAVPDRKVREDERPPYRDRGSDRQSAEEVHVTWPRVTAQRSPTDARPAGSSAETRRWMGRRKGAARSGRAGEQPAWVGTCVYLHVHTECIIVRGAYTHTRAHDPATAARTLSACPTVRPSG